MRTSGLCLLPLPQYQLLLVNEAMNVEIKLDNMRWYKKDRTLYSILEDSPEPDTHLSKSRPQRSRSACAIWVRIFLHLAYGFLWLSVGIAVGYSMAGQSLEIDTDGFIDPAGSVTKTFHYNRTFSNAPNATTDEAWNSIFPKGFGFVQHPTISPNQSGIAVFHQLHCLNGLRKQYYQAVEKKHLLHDAVIEVAGRQHEHHDPAHARHCFDLLRQSLMCAADTNIEPINEELGGVTGWNGVRKCRDFRQVFDWASRWAYKDPVREMVKDHSGNGS